MLSVRRFSAVILSCLCFPVVNADSNYIYSDILPVTASLSQTSVRNSIDNVSSSIVRFENINQTIICFSATPRSFDCSLLAEQSLSDSNNIDRESRLNIDIYNSFHAFEHLYLENSPIQHRLEQSNVVYDSESQRVFSLDLQNEHAQVVEKNSSNLSLIHI